MSQKSKVYIKLNNIWSSIVDKCYHRQEIYNLFKYYYPGIHKATCANWLNPTNNKWAVGVKGRCKFAFPCFRGMNKKHCTQFKERSNSFLTKNNSFPSGLLPMLKDWGYKEEIPIIVYDQRVKPDRARTKKIAWIGPTLYDHQNESKNIFCSVGRGIIKAPTGSGKTIIASNIIHKLSVRTLYIVNSKPLLHQIIEKLQECLKSQIGQIGDGVWDEQFITVATVQSISKNIKNADELLKNIDLLILDENHHSSASTWFNIAKSCPAFYRLGLSATPLCNEDISDLKVKAVTGAIITEINEEDMIEKGYIAQPNFKVLKYKEEKTDCDTFSDEYRRYVTLNTKYNCLVADTIQPFIESDKKILILVEHARHMEVLSKFIPDAQYTYGDDPGIKSKLTAFKRADSGCLICTPVLSEGVDLPTVDVLCIAGQGKKWTRTIQQIGRGMRSGKDNRLLVIDVIMLGLANLTKHGRNRLATYKKIYPNSKITIEEVTPIVWNKLPDTRVHTWYAMDELSEFYDVLPSDVPIVEAIKYYEECVFDQWKEERRIFNWDNIKSDSNWKVFEKIVDYAEQANIPIRNYIRSQFVDVDWVKTIHEDFRMPTPKMLCSRSCINRALKYKGEKVLLKHKLSSSWHIIDIVTSKRGIGLHEAVKMTKNQLHPLFLLGYWLTYRDESIIVSTGEDKPAIQLLENDIEKIEKVASQLTKKKLEYVKKTWSKTEMEVIG